MYLFVLALDLYLVIGLKWRSDFLLKFRQNSLTIMGNPTYAILCEKRIFDKLYPIELTHLQV